MHGIKPVGSLLAWLASADLSTKENHLVTHNGATGLALADAVHESIFGVIDNGAASASRADLIPWMHNWPVKVKCSAAVADAAYLQLDTANPGQLVTQTTGPAVAQALEACSGAAVILVRPIASDGRANGQPAAVALNATGTMADGSLLAGLITSSTAAAVAGTTRTGTQISAELPHVGIGQYHDVSIVNTGAANDFTLTAGTDVTIVGSAVVQENTSVVFRFKKLTATTWSATRIAG